MTTPASKIVQQAPLRVFGNRKDLFSPMPYGFPEENVLQSSSQSRPSFSAAGNKWYWKAQLQTQSHFTSLKLQTDLVCHELQPQHLYSTLQDLKLSLCCEQVPVPALWLGKLHARESSAWDKDQPQLSGKLAPKVMGQGKRHGLACAKQGPNGTHCAEVSTPANRGMLRCRLFWITLLRNTFRL